MLYPIPESTTEGCRGGDWRGHVWWSLGIPVFIIGCRVWRAMHGNWRNTSECRLTVLENLRGVMSDIRTPQIGVTCIGRSQTAKSTPFNSINFYRRENEEPATLLQCRPCGRGRTTSRKWRPTAELACGHRRMNERGESKLKLVGPYSALAFGLKIRHCHGDCGIATQWNLTNCIVLIASKTGNTRAM